MARHYGTVGGAMHGARRAASQVVGGLGGTGATVTGAPAAATLAGTPLIAAQAATTAGCTIRVSTEVAAAPIRYPRKALE